LRTRLTYANVVSTLALFLVLTGGVVYAASKIRTSDIRRHAVNDRKLGPDSVKNGKLADAAVGSAEIQDAAVGNAQVKDDSIEPAKLTFPVFYAASPSGGAQAVTGGPDPYALTGNRWPQGPEQVQVIFGEATATLAYDGSGSGSCQVFFDLRLDGNQVGGGQIDTASTTPETLTRSLGAQPEIGPVAVAERELTARVGSNGDCEPGSTIDATRFRVLDFG
jgi:hypothetical protein